MSQDKNILNIDEVIKKQNTNLSTGLTEDEANKRLQQFGQNEIPENQESVVQRIFRRLWGPIPWMIEVAAIL
jgi:H+-transporting ATPase